ncbi:hypothetical protein J5X98_24380 [Leptothermofonsia sichuanensis E412]|uniref:hypothetical protein n=1 Tax=Leptothermofonsia sichuanensis TaxID=2917832 RepID=UPI001CA764A8|nr:hypothetical protein [Leptothermofonsia sichuanensis]QZZ20356.1 hypothetical protein J5X98_24380 [Leptothermofonsia sichuanensis E412]
MPKRGSSSLANLRKANLCKVSAAADGTGLDGIGRLVLQTLARAIDVVDIALILF